MHTSLLFLAACCAAEPPHTLRIVPQADPARVEVAATLPAPIPFPEGKVDAAVASQRLRLCLVDPDTGREGSPILGTYERKVHTLLFRPRHPLAPGQLYRATLHAKGGGDHKAEYRVPPRDQTEPSVVVKTYPTTDEVPANLLKFYLYFSRPMRESREIFDHLELRKENGEAVLDPWRRTELWSADGKRLTLWIHPGRVKEGVNLREQLGPVLEPAKKYTLVVGTGLRDATGRPLGKEFTRTFRVTAPLHVRPAVAEWAVRAPAAGTSDPLTVTFPRPLDHALLGRCLAVLDPHGKPLDGRAEVGPGERSWRFYPGAPWQSADHTLAADERLEDLAGNTPARLFEVDLAARVEDKPRLSRGFRPEPPLHKPLNFLFILIDDLGWRDLGCYGSTFYETPHIDALARRGMRFAHAYATCPVCSPSRASILTGKYPARLHLTDYIGAVAPRHARLRVPDWKPYLDPAEVTLPQLLKKAGYVSGCVGKWHLGGNQLTGNPDELRRFSPERHGFDVSVAAGPAGQPPDYFFPYGRTVAGREVGLPNLPGGRPGQYLTDHLTDLAEEFLERHKDRPFFLYLAHYAVHTSMGDRLQGKKDKVERYRAKRKPGQAQNNPEYAAMVESMDESVGRVLRTLDRLKLADRTIVFFTSDNGGYDRATSNLPLRGAKSQAYEGGIRVPLIVAGPGVAQGGCETPVTGTDYLPTLLDLAGIGTKAAPPADGESLLPLLRRTGGLRRDAIYWHYPHYSGHRTTPFGAVRQGDFKLIEYFEGNRVELYNLRDDPGESRDLAAAAPDKARDLRQRLAAWRREVGAQMPRPAGATDAAPAGR